MTVKTENKNWKESVWQDALQRDLREPRALAWKAFEETGFPTLKDEFWRYTSTAFVNSNEFHFSALPKPSTQVLAHLKKSFSSFQGSARIVFLDGWFFPQFSDLNPIAEQVDFSSVKDLAENRPDVLANELENEKGLSALNAALFQDGFWLNVRPGAKPVATLLVYFLNTSSTSKQTEQLRHSITLGEGAALKMVEWHDHLGGSESFSNHELKIDLAPAAMLEHFRLQQAGDAVWMRNSSNVTLAQKSHYHRLDLDSGAKVSRNEIKIVFSGGESLCALNGIGLGLGERHLDTQVIMNHSVPGASSTQSYRNLLSGKSRGVFGGGVKVHRDAQKTDARQVHKTLLLSDDARADTKPQLEIDADDVQCSHGAAIGQLDEDSLFYLRSRGISRANAEKILASGFVEKLLDSISCGSLRSFFKDQLESELARLF